MSFYNVQMYLFFFNILHLILSLYVNTYMLIYLFGQNKPDCLVSWLVVMNHFSSISEVFCSFPSQQQWLQVTGNTGKVLVGSAAYSMVTLPKKAGSSIQISSIQHLFKRKSILNLSFVWRICIFYINM